MTDRDSPTLDALIAECVAAGWWVSFDYRVPPVYCLIGQKNSSGFAASRDTPLLALREAMDAARASGHGFAEREAE